MIGVSLGGKGLSLRRDGHESGRGFDIGRVSRGDMSDKLCVQILRVH